MADKLKCPFCGEELDPRFDAYHETITSWVCINEKCVSFDWEFPPKAWQALIQAKQDLGTARKALEYYADSRFGKKQDDGTYVLEIDKGCGVTVVYTYDPRPAKQALEQIEHKE